MPSSVLHGDRVPPDRPRTRDLHFRMIRPEDVRRLQRFHQRLSIDTVERRFHGAKRELSVPLAHRFTHLDGENEVAWVATTGTRGRIVAVARYSRIDAQLAEVAFVVEDAYQGLGIGKRLMTRLRRTAIENGVQMFIAEVLPGNRPMLSLLEEAGPTKVRFDGSVLQVLVDLRDGQVPIGQG